MRLRANIAVVVNLRGNHYLVHRIVLPDGRTFKFDQRKQNDATQELHRGVPKKGSLADATSVAPIYNLSRNQNDVKKDSARYQQNEAAAELLQQENDRLNQDVAELTPLVQALRKMNGGKIKNAYRLLRR